MKFEFGLFNVVSEFIQRNKPHLDTDDVVVDATSVTDTNDITDAEVAAFVVQVQESEDAREIGPEFGQFLQLLGYLEEIKSEST